jgi:hypothetical protein
MDHRRPLHQPAAPNKLICGRTWLVFEAKPSGKDRRAYIMRRDKARSVAPGRYAFG